MSDNPWGWVGDFERSYRHSRFWVRFVTTLMAGNLAYNLRGLLMDGRPWWARAINTAIIVATIWTGALMWRSHLELGRMIRRNAACRDRWADEHQEA